jgi:hypothetical protein
VSAREISSESCFGAWDFTKGSRSSASFGPRSGAARRALISF